MTNVARKINKCQSSLERWSKQNFDHITRELCVGDDNVAALLVDYYTGLFTTANPCSIESVLQHVPRIVTEEMNSLLGHEFTREEVDAALS